MDLKKLHEERQKSCEGRWYDILDDGKVLLAKFNNPNHKAKMQRLGKDNVSRIRSGTITDKEFKNISLKAMIGTVLLGWKNISDGEKALKFSEDTAFEILIKYPSFAETIEDLAQNVEFQEQEELDSTIKKS